MGYTKSPGRVALDRSADGALQGGIAPGDWISEKHLKRWASVFQVGEALTHPHRGVWTENTVPPGLGRRTIGVTTPTDRRTPEGATVSTQSIIEWVAAVTSNLLPSQSRALTALVA